MSIQIIVAIITADLPHCKPCEVTFGLPEEFARHLVANIEIVVVPVYEDDPGEHTGVCGSYFKVTSFDT